MTIILQVEYIAAVCTQSLTVSLHHCTNTAHINYQYAVSHTVCGSQQRVWVKICHHSQHVPSSAHLHLENIKVPQCGPNDGSTAKLTADSF